MTMTISEALRQLDNLVQYTGLDSDRKALAVLRSRLEVNGEMVQTALTRYLGIESPYTREVAMKAALVAALGDSHDRA